MKLAIMNVDLKNYIMCEHGSLGCYDLPQEKSLCPFCKEEEK